MESAHAPAERARQALTAKLEVLELHPEDICKELAEQGTVLRRKMREVGEAITEARIDVRATTVIESELASDLDLAALNIAVATTVNRVKL